MTHPYLRAKRQRTNVWGRIYSVAGGAPNRPTVVFAARARWVPDESCSWPVMRLDGLWFEHGWSSVADHSEVRAHIERDLDVWRSTDAPGIDRWRMPVVLAVETSQNPPLYTNLEDLARDEEQRQSVRAEGFRLRTGDASPSEDDTPIAGQTKTAGAAWLVSQFNASASLRPDESSPGRVTVSFAEFEDRTGAGMNREDVRSALSAAEKLHAKASTGGPDIAISLSADEASAAAVMTAWMAGDRSRPPAQWAETPWGWDDNRPVHRRIRGIY